VNYLLLFVMTLSAAAASLCLKKAGGSTGLINILKNKYFYTGGFLYLMASITNIWLLQRMPYSVVLPMGGICYMDTVIIPQISKREDKQI
jgi:hypothetical protein